MPTHVVLITGWDLEPSLDDPVKWGIDVVLTKPIDIRELIDTLHSLLPPPAPEGS